MRTKILVTVMSFLLVLGFTLPVSAGWVDDDVVDNNPIPIKNLKRTLVDVFEIEDPPDTTLPSHKEIPWMYHCFEMEDGSSMPGMIMWEFDVDNNTDTGGNTGMLRTPVFCTHKDASYPGIDIIVFKYFRDQGPDSANSWCKDGLGFVPGAPCTGCDEAGCRDASQMCLVPGPGCVTIDTMCVCNEAPCYVPGDPWETPNCEGKGVKIGEWIAKAVEKNGVIWPPPSLTVDYGRDIPKPPEAGTGDGIGYCQKLPWGEILRAASASGAEFDLATALTTTPDYVVSIYHDPVFADEDDYATGISCDMADYLPQVGKAASQESDGGDCHNLQGKYHCCLDQMAKGSTCDAGLCNAETANGQGACEDAGCLWNPQGLPSPGQCVSAICNGDQDFSGRVTGGDLSVLKKDLGRVTTCPCGQ